MTQCTKWLNPSSMKLGWQCPLCRTRLESRIHDIADSLRRLKSSRELRIIDAAGATTGERGAILVIWENDVFNAAVRFPNPKNTPANRLADVQYTIGGTLS